MEPPLGGHDNTMSGITIQQQQLVEECQGLVRFLARRLHSRLPRSVELDDLIGYGQIGLLQAAGDYDPNQGTKFSSFAFYRIRGAIYDGAQKLQWFRKSRSPVMKFDELSDSVQEHAEASGSPQKNDLSSDANWFRNISGSLASVYLSSQCSGADEVSTEIEDRSTVAPWSEMDRMEISQKLKEAIQSLPADSAALVRAVYFENQTLQEAGQRLGISKSWASRMHARAIEQLARCLRGSGVAEAVP